MCTSIGYWFWEDVTIRFNPTSGSTATGSKMSNCFRAAINHIPLSTVCNAEAWKF